MPSKIDEYVRAVDNECRKAQGAPRIPKGEALYVVPVDFGRVKNVWASSAKEAHEVAERQAKEG